MENQSMPQCLLSLETLLLLFNKSDIAWYTTSEYVLTYWHSNVCARKIVIGDANSIEF